MTAWGHPAQNYCTALNEDPPQRKTCPYRGCKYVGMCTSLPIHQRSGKPEWQNMQHKQWPLTSMSWNSYCNAAYLTYVSTVRCSQYFTIVQNQVSCNPAQSLNGCSCKLRVPRKKLDYCKLTFSPVFSAGSGRLKPPRRFMYCLA